MKTIITPLLAAGLLLAAAPAAFAQDGPTSVETSGDTHAGAFLTFEPTEEELVTFRSSGQIAHEGGKAVYDNVCAGCHMDAGEGAVGAGMYPAFTDSMKLAAAAYPILVIVNGQKAMPAFGGMLDDQQIADVVNYIRSNFGNDFIEEWGEATVEDVAVMRQ